MRSTWNGSGGSQFSSDAFTELLRANGIAISMDGRGAWRDNVFVERLWRSLKYKEVYLRAYDSVGEARASLSRYLVFYNKSGRIQVLTRGRRSVFTMNICRRHRMNQTGRGST